MEEYSGKSAFGGAAVGTIRVYRKNAAKIVRRRVDNVEDELRRFRRAAAEARAQLSALYEKAVREAGAENAEIFEIHRMMLDDADYVEATENCIKSQAANAEYAVATVGKDFGERLRLTGDEYMSARAQDVNDITERLLTVLSGESKAADFGSEPFVLVAEDLTPSETISLDKNKILALVTVHGSVNSHTAILARTMNIPAVVGVALSLDGIDGKTAAVDGYGGKIYIDPDDKTLEAVRERRRADKERETALRALKGRASVTLDGHRIKLYANIGDVKDIGSVLENDGEGIGLFRSEFIYLGRSEPPSEEEQFAIYKAAAEAMGGKKVIIRTLDIGADKKAEYLNLKSEENPALGLRAIRLCLSRPELFKAQLRAILRASLYGNIAIMYPMITAASEILRINSVVEQAEDELRAASVPFGKPECGIMIETPAAAVASDLLAPLVDFFSIGTNDLCQYAAAIDRRNPELDEFFDPYSPAVLRMIKTTVDNAHRFGKWAGICGEMGGDTSLTELFAAMGIDELSVSPTKILPVREKIVRINAEKAKESVFGKFGITAWH